MHGSIQSLDLNIGDFAGGGLQSFLLITALCFLMILFLLTAIVKMRGQSMALAASCTRDVLIAAGLALTVIGFPAAVYFMTRAVWRSATFQG